MPEKTEVKVKTAAEASANGKAPAAEAAKVAEKYYVAPEGVVNRLYTMITRLPSNHETIDPIVQLIRQGFRLIDPSKDAQA